MLRLVHASTWWSSTGGAHIFDARYYHDLARGLGERGAGAAAEVASFANVGYTWLLRALASSAGESLYVVAVAQAVAGALSVVLVGVAARSLTRSSTVGLVAAALLALYAPALHFEALLLIPAFDLLLASAALALVAIGSKKSAAMPWFLAGACVGAATLLRASSAIAVVSYAAAAFLLRRSVREVALKQALAVLFGAALFVVPAAVSASSAAGEWVFVSANGGMNLWVGNHERATGSYENAPFLGASRGGDFEYTLVTERERFHEEARRRTGDSKLTLVAADRYWARAALADIGSAPGAWLARTVAKARLLIGNQEPRTNSAFELTLALSPLVRVAPLRFGVLFALGAAGVALLARRRRARLVLVTSAALAAPLAACLLFFVSGEYRHPAAAPLVVLAAAGLVATAKYARRRIWPRGRRGALAMALFAMVMPLALTLPKPGCLIAKDLKAYSDALASPGFGGRMPTRETYAAARALLAHAGDDYPSAVTGLEGLLLVSSNEAIQFRDEAAARRLVETASSLWQLAPSPAKGLAPSDARRIHNNLRNRVQQLARQPFVAEWETLPTELQALGGQNWAEAEFLIGMKKLAEAERFLDRALGLCPSSVEVLAARGKLEEARGGSPTQWFEASLAAFPALALPALHLASYYRGRGELERAREYLELARAREPKDPGVAELERTLPRPAL